jgi:NAD(P)-dependent dehydrogenase (short-subunit alcohol dehydrogenase family)
MGTPRRHSADGYELQLATNHLGHFALTGLLLGSMEGREDARVVTLSSTAHRMGRINFDNLQESAATSGGAPMASRSSPTAVRIRARSSPPGG